MEGTQDALFTADEYAYEEWREHWRGMPEYANRNLEPWKSVLVHFACREDMDAFAELVGQTVPGIGPGGSIWYPKAEINRMVDKRYVDVEDVEDVEEAEDIEEVSA